MVDVALTKSTVVAGTACIHRDLPHSDPSRPYMVFPGEEGPRVGGGVVSFVYTEELSCPIFAPLFARELECISRSLGLQDVCSVLHSTRVTPRTCGRDQEELGLRGGASWQQAFLRDLAIAARGPFSSKWAK